MGRHHQRPEHRLGRLALATGALTAGVLPVVLPGLAAAAPPAPPPATPCAPTAKACVDISEKKAWLTDGAGHVTRGPVDVTTGAPGEDTPQGTFHVMWKDQYHHSREQDGAPMPYSVFFADGGRAFHGGSLERASAGCVHLGPEDSKAFFDHLQVNDEVQVVP